jgi:hypothetical protein
MPLVVIQMLSLNVPKASLFAPFIGNGKDSFKLKGNHFAHMTNDDFHFRKLVKESASEHFQDAQCRF